MAKGLKMLDLEDAEDMKATSTMAALFSKMALTGQRMWFS